MTQEEDCPPLSEPSWALRARNFMLFVIMGSGIQWVLPNALAQEIPYLENNVPEGLCISTYMNISSNFGVISMLFYLYIYTYVYPIPYSVSVPTLLSFSVFGCFFAGFVYTVSYGGISFMLLVACAIGGSVGALSSVIMNPFMTSYENQYITAVRSGNSVFTLVTAGLAAIQEPGGNMNFSFTSYMCIFGCILTGPLASYFYITKSALGLRESDKQLDADAKMGGAVGGENQNPLVASLTNLSPDMSDSTNKSKQSKQDGDGKGKGKGKSKCKEITTTRNSDDIDGDDIELSVSLNGSKEETEDHDDESSSYDEYNNAFEFGNSWEDRVLDQITSRIIPDSWEMPWLRRTLPYMAAVGFVNFNTWGMLTALMPFALSNASKSGDGSQALAAAYEVGALCLVLGDMSTTIIRLPFMPSLCIFCVCAVNIYIAAGNAPAFHTPAAPGLLVACFSIGRFIEAHILTSSYRAVATRFPPNVRERCSRMVGLSDQLCTTMGSILSAALVILTLNCSSEDD